jgi:membrane associated rhomboid family serine protease
VIPLRDNIPSRTRPVVMVALIAACALVFLHTLSLGSQGAMERLVADYGIIPAQFTGHSPAHGPVPLYARLLTNLFLHGGWIHLLGNMLFLWIFGDNVEDYFGHFPYLLFYFVCGIGSGLTHIIFNYHSSLPALGASGAISGVMGAYIILYPRARVLTLVFIFFIPIPAFIILGYWFLLQFVAGISTVGASATGGVAWWAHIGGFLMGMVITGLSLGDRKQSVSYS